MAVIQHSIVVGQSNAAGGGSDAPVSTDPQTNQRALTFTSGGATEPITNTNNQYFPVFGLSQLVQRTICERTQPFGPQPYLMSVNTHAKGGTPYSGLKKGTATYAEALSYLQAAKNNQAGIGNTVKARSMHVVHGEADAGAASRATYLGFLNEWLSDFDADLRAITGQTERLIGVVSQLGSSQGSGSGVPVAQLDAHRTNPRYVMACPQYPYPLAGDGSQLHFSARSHYRNGEFHARALRTALFSGMKWEPVHPKAITRDGAVVTVVFNVPAPPLTIDTALVASAGVGRGFTYLLDGVAQTISSVAVTAPDTVTITLAATPVGSEHRVAYGHQAARGNLRDSDATPSALDDAPLYNWCCHFNDPVGYVYTPLALPADVLTPTAPDNLRLDGVTRTAAGYRLDGVARTVAGFRLDGQSTA